MLIHLINVIPDGDCGKVFDVILQDIDWKTLLKNAKINELIPEKPSEPYIEKTVKNVNLLVACIDNEKTN